MAIVNTTKQIKIKAASRGAFTPTEYWTLLRAARAMRGQKHPSSNQQQDPGRGTLLHARDPVGELIRSQSPFVARRVRAPCWRLSSTAKFCAKHACQSPLGGLSAPRGHGAFRKFFAWLFGWLARSPPGAVECPRPLAAPGCVAGCWASARVATTRWPARCAWRAASV